jgi:hypothetical protein
MFADIDGMCVLECCRMLMCPWGSSLLLGNANGGIRRLQIGSDDPVEHRPKLVEVSGQQFGMLAPGQHAIACNSSLGVLRQQFCMLAVMIPLSTGQSL